jgi:hypothetical protein
MTAAPPVSSWTSHIAGMFPGLTSPGMSFVGDPVPAHQSLMSHAAAMYSAAFPIQPPMTQQQSTLLQQQQLALQQSTLLLKQTIQNSLKALHKPPTVPMSSHQLQQMIINPQHPMANPQHPMLPSPSLLYNPPPPYHNNLAIHPSPSPSMSSYHSFVPYPAAASSSAVSNLHTLTGMSNPNSYYQNHQQFNATNLHGSTNFNGSSLPEGSSSTVTSSTDVVKPIQRNRRHF